MEGMVFVSAATTESDIDRALEALEAQVGEQVSEEQATFDLVLVFFSDAYKIYAHHIADRLNAAFAPEVLLGCTAEGVISSTEEIEKEAGISLLAACLPNAVLDPFYLQSDRWPSLLLDEEEFVRRVGASQEAKLFLALGDPFSMPADDLLAAFNSYFPGVPMVGGMASGALRPNGNLLLMNDRVLDEGMVGVALCGDFHCDTIVSQGCRPIWRPFQVESARKNVIFRLEGRPPMALIEELVSSLSALDRDLLQSGLYIGKAIQTEEPEALGRGDFLVRGVIAMDQHSGAIAVADSVEEGGWVQFHVRDAESAREDLEILLVPQAFRPPAAGALLFACNGRGTRLYEQPNGDISIIQEQLGGVPLAGFFCAGEIGPVGEQNFLHGQTASLLIFRPGR